MTKKLFAQAMGKFLMGVLGVGLLIFLPAGTLRFYEGWLLMGVLFVPRPSKPGTPTRMRTSPSTSFPVKKFTFR